MSKALSDHDSAIWRTLRINDLIDAGRFGEVETVGTTFPPSLGQGERVVACGGYTLNEHSAVGDGTYYQDNSFLFATGVGGVAMSATYAVGRAIGNSARRQAARNAATPRWRPVDNGSIFVSDWGFYLHSTLGFRPWSWAAVHTAELVGPGLVRLSGNSTTGPIQWIIQSDWAELLFSLWARARHPQHPQFLNAAWVPPGWADRVAASPYDAPPSVSGRWGHLMLPQSGA